MKNFFIGILLFPLIIFAVGLVLVLAGKGLDFILPSKEKPAAEETAAPSAEKVRTQPTTSAPKAISKVTVKYSATQYYTATGSTRDEIRASMAQAKLGTFLGGHDAATTAETNINFARRQLTDKCEAVMTRLDLILAFTYPKWTPSQGASSDLIAKWDSFLAALKIHEEGHAKIEIERANIVMQELQKIPAQSTCEAFDGVWQAKADALDQETKSIEAQYDRDTQSGKSQGVAF